MKFDATDQRAMLEALGSLATVPEDGELYVQFHGPGTQVDYEAGGVVSTPPWCIAAQADVDDLEIVGDQDDGTIITVEGGIWRVLSIEPRIDGFVEITLGEVAP